MFDNDINIITDLNMYITKNIEISGIGMSIMQIEIGDLVTQLANQGPLVTLFLLIVAGLWYMIINKEKQIKEKSDEIKELNKSMDDELKELNEYIRDSDKENMAILSNVNNTLDKVLNNQNHSNEKIIKELDSLRDILIIKIENIKDRKR